MPTTVISAIKAAGGGDYTTLAAWEVAKKGNLVVADQIQIAEVYGGGSVGVVSLLNADWTTNATHYVQIRAASGEGHGGVFNDSKAYITAGFATNLIVSTIANLRVGPGISLLLNQYAIGLSISEPGNCIVDGLILRSTASSTATGIKFHRCSNNIVRNCIIQLGSDGTSIKYGIYCSGSTISAAVSVYNCTFRIKGANLAALYAYAAGGSTSVITSQNCYCAVSDSAVFYLAEPTNPGSFSKGSNDASNNTEVSDADLQNIAYSTDNFTSITAGSENLHLTNTSDLKGVGADLSGYFTTDIDEETRRKPFDIGADGFPEVVVVVKYINPNGSGDYTTLSNWWNDRKGDIVSRNTIETARMQGSTYHASGVQMLPSGVVVDPEHYFIIEAASGNSHAGIFNRTRSFLQLESAIDIQVGYTRIGVGMCFHSNLDVGNPDPIIIQNIAEDTPVIVDRAIIHHYNGNGILVKNCSGVTGHVVKNCSLCLLGGTNCGITADGSGTQLTVYNSTITGRIVNGLKAKNNASIITQNVYIGTETETAVCYKEETGGTITKGSHDMTFNTEASGTDRRNILLNKTNFYYPNAGGWGWHEGQTGIEDIHIPAGSALKGMGLDLSAITPETFRPLVGIDSHNRTTWDVGADEYTTPTIIENTIGEGGDYATLTLWAEARKGNLALRDTVEVALVAGSGGILSMPEADWGTNSKNNVIIKAASGFEHNGVYRTDRAYIKIPDLSANNATAIDCGVGGTHIGPGLVIDTDYDVSGGGGHNAFGIKISGESAAQFIIEGNIIVSTDSLTFCKLISTTGLVNYYKKAYPVYEAQLAIIRNNIMYARGSGAYGISGADTLEIVNNTIYIKPAMFGGYALYLSGIGVNLEDNNYMTGWKVYSGITTKGVHTATHNDEAYTASLQNIAYDDTNFINVTEGTEDLHILKTSSLYRKGITITGVTVDIDNELRPSVPSIGADDFPGNLNSLFIILW